MAIFKTRPFISIQNQGEFSAFCAQNSLLSGYSHHKNFKYSFKLGKNCERKRLKLMKGYKLESGNGYYGVLEDDKTLVEVLREAQPYIDLHRGRTFVLVLSAQVVDGPHLSSLLQVSFLSLSNNFFFLFFNLINKMKIKFY